MVLVYPPARQALVFYPGTGCTFGLVFSEEKIIIIFLRCISLVNSVGQLTFHSCCTLNFLACPASLFASLFRCVWNYSFSVFKNWLLPKDCLDQCVFIPVVACVASQTQFVSWQINIPYLLHPEFFSMFISQFVGSFPSLLMCLKL